MASLHSRGIHACSQWPWLSVCLYMNCSYHSKAEYATLSNHWTETTIPPPHSSTQLTYQFFPNNTLLLLSSCISTVTLSALSPSSSLLNSSITCQRILWVDPTFIHMLACWLQSTLICDTMAMWVPVCTPRQCNTCIWSMKMGRLVNASNETREIGCTYVPKPLQ